MTASRRIVGVVGCPGAGKSTLAARIAAEIGDTAVVVPMDGFHLAGRVLERLGRHHRKGAPDTFDVGGYVHLLERVRVRRVTVYAPEFRRDVEEPIAGAIEVAPRHTVVVTEGNYLLHEAGGWERVRPLLDECWYLDGDDESRRRRLIARHIRHGRSEAEARRWVDEVDEPNAALVRATRERADRIVNLG
jgi:pantothenate kinase